MARFQLIFVFLAGTLTLAAAIFDWNWFFENRKAALFVETWGRNGARVFYAVLGVVIFILGFWML